MAKPIGDLKDAIFRMMTEDSLAYTNDDSLIVEPDEDFKYFNELINMPEDQWDLGFKNDYITVYKQKDFNKHEVMIKCEAILPRIPKYVAFEALADIHVRKKWDEVLWNLTIIEESLKESTYIFYYNIRSPSFMQSRECIVSSKIMTDFPT